MKYATQSCRGSCAHTLTPVPSVGRSTWASLFVDGEEAFIIMVWKSTFSDATRDENGAEGEGNGTRDADGYAGNLCCAQRCIQTPRY